MSLSISVSPTSSRHAIPPHYLWDTRAPHDTITRSRHTRNGFRNNQIWKEISISILAHERRFSNFQDFGIEPRNKFCTEQSVHRMDSVPKGLVKRSITDRPSKHLLTHARETSTGSLINREPNCTETALIDNI